MRFRIVNLAGICVVAAAMLAMSAPAQKTKGSKPSVKKGSKPMVKKSAKASSHAKKHRRHRRRHRHTHVKKTASVSHGNGVETGLIGVHIMDSGAHVLALYGNPDEILNIGQAPNTAPGPTGGGQGFGGQAPGGAPGFAGNPGAGAGAGNPGTRRGPRGVSNGGGGREIGPGLPSISGGDIFGTDFQDDSLFQQGRGRGGFNPPPGVPGGGGPFGPPPGAGGPPRGFQGGGGGLPPGVPGGNNQPGLNGGQVNSEPAPTPYYVQWVYKKGPSRYTFIIDKKDRVVQIEAVGMGDPRVRTSRGISFGATFKDIMERYSAPDGYEINSGDSLVVRYLAKNHVAFRLNRLETDKPYEVTAMVIAGGKG